MRVRAFDTFSHTRFEPWAYDPNHLRIGLSDATHSFFFHLSHGKCLLGHEYMAVGTSFRSSLPFVRHTMLRVHGGIIAVTTFSSKAARCVATFPRVEIPYKNHTKIHRYITIPLKRNARNKAAANRPTYRNRTGGNRYTMNDEENTQGKRMDGALRKSEQLPRALSSGHR